MWNCSWKVPSTEVAARKRNTRPRAEKNLAPSDMVHDFIEKVQALSVDNRLKKQKINGAVWFLKVPRRDGAGKMSSSLLFYARNTIRLKGIKQL